MDDHIGRPLSFAAGPVGCGSLPLALRNGIARVIERVKTIFLHLQMILYL